jgi:Acyl-protein synthetase, LuxE
MMQNDFDQLRNQLYKQYFHFLETNKRPSDEYLMQLFAFQYKYNTIYHSFCKNLNIKSDDVRQVDQIPYLPISAFKHHKVITGDFESQEVFMSSGTTGSVRSMHYIRSLDHYHKNTEMIWSSRFGDLSQYCFLALLPGYLERDGSSLISMVDFFVHKSQFSQSGFFLRDHQVLYETIKSCQKDKIPVVLFGVTYALLDFTEQYPDDYSDLIIIETGGMKGLRKEMTKEALHQLLYKRTQCSQILSEYGMTELLSQAYTDGTTIFKPNLSLKIVTHQINDPLMSEKVGKPGIICISDLANIDSCAFIQTEDVGVLYENGKFEISGRLEASDWRGCNLLLDELRSIEAKV